jgi:penicillin-binding protein 1A
LIQAFLATEDRRFQEHHGVDYQGIVRAALSLTCKLGDVVEGGSTITQQLARIVYFDQERSMTRKLKEMRMAQKIEQDIDKEKILERYLNLVYLGSGAYGICRCGLGLL